MRGLHPNWPRTYLHSVADRLLSVVSSRSGLMHVSVDGTIALFCPLYLYLRQTYAISRPPKSWAGDDSYSRLYTLYFRVQTICEDVEKYEGKKVPLLGSRPRLDDLSKRLEQVLVGLQPLIIKVLASPSNRRLDIRRDVIRLVGRLGVLFKHTRLNENTLLEVLAVGEVVCALYVTGRVVADHVDGADLNVLAIALAQRFSVCSP
jgi:hypothetical protein